MTEKSFEFTAKSVDLSLLVAKLYPYFVADMIKKVFPYHLLIKMKKLN